MAFFIKAKTLSCNYCGYTGTKFKKWERNLYSCPACEALIDFGFGGEEEILLRGAQSELRRQNFMDAEELFDGLLERYPDNHEARFGRVCARYGIKHEVDFDGKIIPTCCLDSIASFRNDPDFKKAVAAAPAEVAAWYEEQAAYVERISKKWMEEARKEAPYDVFICYKDSEKEAGIERTTDSYEAAELYAWLTTQGYRVFFSRISLASKTGEKFEPFIFNALQTAKVLIVFGSKVGYITSPWVKNEWHRYCKRISLGEKKENSLLVVYKDLNPAELPTILASKQCLNYGDNHFYDVLRRYLDGIFRPEAEKKTATEIQEQPAVPAFTPITEAKRKEKKTVDALHEHSYVAKVVPGSCITRGYTVHICACGDEYKDTYTPLGEHDFTLTKTVDPTCDKTGKKEYTCKVCAEGKSESIPAKGHKYGEWITQKYAECEEEGTLAKQCKVCGDVQTKPIAATGHKWGKWVTEIQPTCEGEGRKVCQCSECGKKKTEPLPAAGHTFSAWADLASDPKKQSRYCTGCGKTETRDKLVKESTSSASSDAQKMDTFFFGTYPQGEMGEKAPIEWLVLKREGNKVLLLSRYALDRQRYNSSWTDVTWESCSLRTWLNGTFYNTAFDTTEKAKIVKTTVSADKNPFYSTNPGNATSDNVFLLSTKEVQKYFISFISAEARKRVPTAYAIARGAYISSSKATCRWWLRSPGFDQSYAALVDRDGFVDHRGSGVYGDDVAVRPALWIDLKS